MIICLILPLLFSGFFYISVILKLLKRNRDTSRNRNLTVAFFLSWLLWLVCWVSHYLGTSFTLDTYPEQKSLLDLLKISLLFYRCSFHMLYPHLNVISLLIVLKPFRSWIIDHAFLLLFSRSPKNSFTSLKNERIGLKLRTFLLVFVCAMIAASLTGSYFNNFKVAEENLTLEGKYFESFQTLSVVQKKNTWSLYDCLSPAAQVAKNQHRFCCRDLEHQRWRR